jgi:Spy/CpxP family protein refolding chaperone
MNKLIVTIITTLLLTVTGSTFAQNPTDGPDRKWQHHQRGMQMGAGLDQLMHALRQLDLSDEQKANTRAILEVMKAEIHPILEETKAGQQQLRELIKSDSYDENAVRALAEKEGDLATERVMITAQALSRVMSQLTDEQRAELDAMAAERKQKRAQRHQEKRK